MSAARSIMSIDDSVIEEIDLLVQKHGVRNIKILDEMFVLNYQHVESVCDRIIERGHDLNIWAYARVDTVKASILDRLKRACLGRDLPDAGGCARFDRIGFWLYFYR